MESKRTSSQLHHWLDLTFGFQLSGQPAIAAKNVALPASDPTQLRSAGRVQLFSSPHPVREPQPSTETTDKGGSGSTTASSLPQPDPQHRISVGDSFSMQHAARLSALQSLQQLRDLEARHVVQHDWQSEPHAAECTASAAVTTSQADEAAATDVSVAEGQAADMRAFGRIVVQLFGGKRLLLGAHKRRCVSHVTACVIPTSPKIKIKVKIKIRIEIRIEYQNEDQDQY